MQRSTDASVHETQKEYDLHSYGDRSYHGHGAIDKVSRRCNVEHFLLQKRIIT